MPQEHIVKSYEQELNRLRDLIVEMGGMVESQVSLACTAILNRDRTAAATALRNARAGLAGDAAGLAQVNEAARGLGVPGA